MHPSSNSGHFENLPEVLELYLLTKQLRKPLVRHLANWNLLGDVMRLREGRHQQKALPAAEMGCNRGENL
jgi:hypothetical protein